MTADCGSPPPLLQPCTATAAPGRRSSRRRTRSVQVHAAAAGGGQAKITQSQFTEKAWQAVIAAPDVAKESQHQIVETEHLLKARTATHTLRPPACPPACPPCFQNLGGDPETLLLPLNVQAVLDLIQPPPSTPSLAPAGGAGAAQRPSQARRVQGRRRPLAAAGAHRRLHQEAAKGLGGQRAGRCSHGRRGEVEKNIAPRCPF